MMVLMVYNPCLMDLFMIEPAENIFSFVLIFFTKSKRPYRIKI